LTLKTELIKALKAMVAQFKALFHTFPGRNNENKSRWPYSIETRTSNL